MQIAAMLIGLALLAAGALVLSLFVNVAGGGSAFDHVWPYLTGVIVALLSVARMLANHARKNPDAWLHRSVWAKVIMVLVVSVVALGFARVLV